jgi:hypothetical protein
MHDKQSTKMPKNGRKQNCLQMHVKCAKNIPEAIQLEKEKNNFHKRAHPIHMPQSLLDIETSPAKFCSQVPISRQLQTLAKYSIVNATLEKNECSEVSFDARIHIGILTYAYIVPLDGRGHLVRSYDGL